MPDHRLLQGLSSTATYIFQTWKVNRGRHYPLGLLFDSTAGCAAESSDTDALPIEVQVDLYMAELTRLLEYDDHVGIVDLVPKIRALNIDIPDALFFIEARALYSTGDA